MKCICERDKTIRLYMKLFVCSVIVSMYVYSMRVYDMLHGGLPVPLRVQGHRVDQDAMGRRGIMMKWRDSQSDRIVPIRTYCKLLRCTIKDISIKKKILLKMVRSNDFRSNDTC